MGGEAAVDVDGANRDEDASGAEYAVEDPDSRG
jgi:hypothetical protein